KEKPRRAAGLSSDGGARGLAKNRGPTRPNWGGGTKNVPLSRLPAPCKDAICALMRIRPRQTSFAEFKMLMTLDYEGLKPCGLPKSMVEQALIKVYETVVLDHRETGITLDGGAAAPWPVNGWGLFVPMEFFRSPCIFWTTAEV